MAKVNKFWDWKLILVLAIFLVLFIPSLFEPLSYGDECIYLTLGQALNKGQVFYRDIHDNKPPMLYLSAAIAGGNLFWFRLLNLAINLLHLGLIYELVKKLTDNKNLGVVSGLFYTLGYLFFEGRTANAEMFMMFFATLATYLIWDDWPKLNFKRGLLAGLLFSIGFLYKVPVGFDFAGIILALFVFSLNKINIKTIKQKLISSSLWAMLIGFISPIGLTIVYYAIRGGLEPYVRSALMQNIGYLSSWGGGGSSDLIWRFVILIGLTGVLFIFRKKFTQKYLYFLLWFLFALFGSQLSGRPYPHYFIEVIPSLVILISLTFNKRKIIRITATAGSIGLMVFTHLYYNFWWYPIIPYYQNFLSYTTGKINKQKYLDYWGDQTEQNYQIAKIIKKNTNPDDRIFVWGEGSCVYALSERLPPGRYTVNYHIYDFDGRDETFQAIEDKKPKMIIKQANESENWPKLNVYLKNNYRLLSYPSLKDKIYFRQQK
jgi:4-amino-4-deoxy-L-arabinose transferase-like glycosyltransferase